MIKRVKRGEVGEKSVIMRWRRAGGREEEGGEYKVCLWKTGGGNALGAGSDGVMHKKWIRNEGKTEDEP